jgi:hypothetical protein
MFGYDAGTSVDFSEPNTRLEEDGRVLPWVAALRGITPELSLHSALTWLVILSCFILLTTYSTNWIKYSFLNQTWIRATGTIGSSLGTYFILLMTPLLMGALHDLEYKRRLAAYRVPL